MQHVTVFAAPLVLGALILAGCQTTQEAAVPPADPAQWLGTWSGAWLGGGQCSSTITVKEVAGITAIAHYTWGSGCGGSNPGQHTDRNASLSGDTLRVSLPGGSGASYVMRDDGSLDGDWWSRGRQYTASAVFRPQ